VKLKVPTRDKKSEQQKKNSGPGIVTRNILILFISVFSPATGFENICNSAPSPNSVIEVNTDINIFPQDSTSVRLFYSTNNQASWTEIPMETIQLPGYENTWQGNFLSPASGTVWYYLQADKEPLRASQSPCNTNDVWPPPDNLLSWVAIEPAGDTFNNPEGPWLDLTGLWLGYSDTYFYFRITNNYNSWPTSGGLLKWYSYAVGFVNPDAPSDSWIFAPVYVNAWPIMQFGLYAINRYTGALPTKISDIEYQTSGNRLDMRCRIDSLTRDTRFGPWPNTAGYLVAAANTQTITATGATLKDTTVPTLWFGSQTQLMTVGQNTPPQISTPRVRPTRGTGETQFFFSVHYLDADNNLPLIHALIVDDDTFELIPSGHNYSNGVNFTVTLSGFQVEWRRFFFLFNDGMAMVASPVDSFFVEGLGLDDETPVQPGIITVSRQTLLLPPAFFINSQLCLFNASGNRVIELKPGFNDISRLGAGVYFVKNRKNLARCIAKVVINK